MIPDLTREDLDRIELFQSILKGDREAALFVSMVYRVFHAWDDLIDRDKEIPDGEINMAFYMAMVNIPRNPFYRANFTELAPVISQAISNWWYSTEAERQAPTEVTFVVRSSYIDIFTKAAEIVGGLNYAIEAQHKIRAWFHSEGYAGYLQNLHNEAALRSKGVANEAQTSQG